MQRSTNQPTEGLLLLNTLQTEAAEERLFIPECTTQKCVQLLRLEERRRPLKDGVSALEVPEMLLEFVHLIVEGGGDVCVWSVGRQNIQTKTRLFC